MQMLSLFRWSCLACRSQRWSSETGSLRAVAFGTLWALYATTWWTLLCYVSGTFNMHSPLVTPLVTLEIMSIPNSYMIILIHNSWSFAYNPYTCICIVLLHNCLAIGQLLVRWVAAGESIASHSYQVPLWWDGFRNQQNTSEFCVSTYLIKNSEF